MVRCSATTRARPFPSALSGFREPNRRNERRRQEPIQGLESAQRPEDLHDRLEPSVLSGLSALQCRKPHPRGLGKLGLRDVLLEPIGPEPTTQLTKHLTSRVSRSYLSHYIPISR